MSCRPDTPTREAPVTDLQDLILDRLVGAKLGANLPDSPLRVAAEVVSGEPIAGTEFVGSGISEAGNSRVARILGYPVQLCEAFQGVLGRLPDEESRRRFAMSFFRLIPCGGPQPKLSHLMRARLAASLAVRAHLVTCGDSMCEAPAKLRELELMEPLSAQEYVIHGLGLRCSAVRKRHPHGMPFTFLTEHSTPLERLERLSRHTISGFASRKSNAAWWAVRLATELIVAASGASAGMELCIGIARRCGMTVEGV